jgi:hypothetical protein
MKRTCLLTPALVAALVLTPTASARVVELGAVADPVNPSCPADPCEAAVRVTGLQGSAAGGPKNPYYIRRDGYIVAFTVTLAQPTAEQINFFNDNFGSPPELGLAVMRQGRTRKTRLNYRLVNQSQLFEVQDYFGSKPTFVLDRPMRVKKTNWLGITVPSWAPIFANNLTRSDWWRASRAKDSCEAPRSLRQFAMTELREVNTFGCTYSGARLLYTATYVPDPRPTVKEEENQP